MVTLLRIAALVLLIAGIIIAIEGLPQRADAVTHARTAVQCLTQNLTLVDVPQPGAGEGAVGPTALLPCDLYLPSVYVLIAGVLSSLLFGGLGSLIYNVKRSRLVMERFDDTAQGTH